MCPSLPFKGQMVANMTGQYCFCYGTGKGPKYLNGEKIIEKEHDMKESCHVAAKVS